MKEKDLDQIQKILKDNEIPTAANSVTLALLYKAAEEAENAGDKDQALDCYRMVLVTHVLMAFLIYQNLKNIESSIGEKRR
nr:hypothetical protein [uncultured Butyrivibrio sp.]